MVLIEGETRKETDPRGCCIIKKLKEFNEAFLKVLLRVRIEKKYLVDGSLGNIPKFKKLFSLTKTLSSARGDTAVWDSFDTMSN